jgi:hypothetical protein
MNEDLLTLTLLATVDRHFTTEVDFLAALVRKP